jgi:hypothetical protein
LTGQDFHLLGYIFEFQETIYILASIPANWAYPGAGRCPSRKSFFLLGFPWDTSETVRATLDLMCELELDFVEIHLLAPYQGTKMYDIFVELGLIKDAGYTGHDHFQGAECGTLSLSHQELCRLRRAGLRRFYMRPSYAIKVLRGARSGVELWNYARYALRTVRSFLPRPIDPGSTGGQE